MIKDRWIFTPFQNGVARNPKEADQFRDETSHLTEALARESVQNSLDAKRSDSDHVTVSFRMEQPKGADAELLQNIFGGKYREHAKESGLEYSVDEPSILLIEDYGTTGLTGKVDEPDMDGNYFAFIHGVGVTNKDRGKRGRHGLGKAVYPMSSSCSAFFAATLRENESNDVPHFIGQGTLKFRRFGDEHYDPVAYYADQNESKYEIPIQDPEDVRKLCSAFSINRKEPGLSVAVPFVSPDVDIEALKKSLVSNYFFALLSKQLVLDIFGERIDHRNAKDKAMEYAEGLPEELFPFLEECLQASGKNHMEIDGQALVGRSEEPIPEDVIEGLRNGILEGKTIGVGIRLQARRKDRTLETGEIRIFLQQPPELEKGHALYVREGLVLTEESRHFGQRRALALLMAQGDGIAALLGDAENPAHRGWNASSTYVHDRWTKSHASDVIRIARQALPRLFDLLLESEEIRDESVLSPFFPVPHVEEPEIKKPKDGSSPGDKTPEPKKPDVKGKTKPPPTIESTKPSGFRLNSISNGSGGFRIHAENLECTSFLVTTSYRDVDGKRAHDPFDFDFTGSTKFAPKPQIEAFGATLSGCTPNTLAFDVMDETETVEVEVTGFDTHRDLHIEVRCEGE